MEDNIFSFQFKTVSAKPTRQSHKFQKLRHFARLSWNTAALDLQKRSFAGVFQNKCS